VISRYIMAVKRPFHLPTCARPNILSLQPYRCARDDYKDDGTNILLDANENAYGPGLALTSDDMLHELDSSTTPTSKASPAKVRQASRVETWASSDGEWPVKIDLLGLNRYPDPHQIELKQLLCDLRTTYVHTSNALTPKHVFVGVGSDEAIDALLRAFCTPGHDKILTCPPTYGMYSVSACVNDVSIVKVPLIASENFALDVQTISRTLGSDERIKIVYLCSPGNPTGALLPKDRIVELLNHPTWNGVVVVDEAYIDFSDPSASLAELVTEYPNLVVMQTLSKAFGLAGIRLGAAFTSPEIAGLLNSLKAPYNISNPTSQIAMAALQPKHLEVMRKNRGLILQQRHRMVQELPSIPGVGRFLGGFDANFVLVQFLDSPSGRNPSNEVALKVYERLAERKGVVVRFRGKEHGCEGALRITVGTESEVGRFLQELKAVLGEIYGSAGSEGTDFMQEEKKEIEANEVIA
jgi:histidinol-phosphate aminotransferase